MDDADLIRELSGSLHLPRAALREALERPEVIAPETLRLLERAGDGADLDEAEASLVFWGLHVLAHARDRRALSPLLRLQRQDGETVDALLGDAVTTLEVEGVAYLVTTELADRATSTSQTRREREAVHLLPAFDEYLLGYQDRRAVLDDEHFERIVPGGNGIFKPTIVANGRVVGTWRRSGGDGRVDLEPFARRCHGSLPGVRCRRWPALGAERSADPTMPFVTIGNEGVSERARFV